MTSQITRLIVASMSVASVLLFILRQVYKSRWFTIFAARKRTSDGVYVDTFGANYK